MKIFRDNAWYVSFKDLIRFNCPNIIKFNEIDHYYLNEYVVLYDKEAIEYINNRQDIIDYDEVAHLTDEELANKIQDAYNKMLPYFNKFLNTAYDKRKELFKEKEFINSFNIATYYHDGLKDYQKNRKHIDYLMNRDFPKETKYQTK